MEIFGVGMPELIFIFLIAIIVMGPKDMQKAGKTIGKWLRNVVTSDGWKMFQQTSRELRTLPNKLMREANEELGKIEKGINYSIANPAKGFMPPEHDQPVIIGTPEGDLSMPAAEMKENKTESDLEKDA